MQVNLNLSNPRLVDDAAIIKFVDQVLSTAVNQGASDVHFEPQAKHLNLRLRIDGILYALTQISSELTARINARLKIIANLDIAEKRLPQDGRFMLNLNKYGKHDCRISTCPTMFGEKIVIRILNPTNIALDIDNLGLATAQKNILLEQIKKPQGMILVTGPTGSGKTVTLYTILNALNNTAKNISTIEDPIEITLPGINQVEVNHKIGLDFAAALRAFLRQDPDIIMVGEIRDLETANIAIKAAQTGHLVLATLHTNSALDTLNRLQNMGVETFNLASSINLIIAQRLVRKLCPECKQPQPKAAEITPIYAANGCTNCKSGFSGRCGIFEILPLSKNIAALLTLRHSAAEIEQQAMRDGFSNLQQSALNAVLQGTTSLAEIKRVIY